jgi:hypothetical protein
LTDGYFCKVVRRVAADFFIAKMASIKELKKVFDLKNSQFCCFALPGTGRSDVGESFSKLGRLRVI